MVTCIDKPSEIKLWQATNPEKRDFRLASFGPAFKSTDVIDQGGGEYEAKIKKPEKGWTASFVELTFPSGGKYPFKFTTAVRVNPDTLPFRCRNGRVSCRSKHPGSEFHFDFSARRIVIAARRVRTCGGFCCWQPWRRFRARRPQFRISAGSRN